MSPQSANDARWVRLVAIENKLCDRVDALDFRSAELAAQGDDVGAANAKGHADFVQRRLERIRAVRMDIP